MSFKRPDEMAKEAVDIGIKKTQLSLSKVFILAILAGAFIGLGAELSTIVSHDVGKISVGLSRFMAGSVFSLGLILVVIAGAELFTGNCLMTMSLFEKKVNLSQLLKCWTVVYIGNFVGSLLLVFLIFYSGVYGPGNSAISIFAVEIAAKKVNLSFSQALLSGIACNFLVVLAIWLALAGRDIISKIAGIYFPIMAFVASGFEHSIANMFFIPMGILLKNSVSSLVFPFMSLENLNIAGFLINNLLPVTIGNIIGGAIFVGAVYWYVYVHKIQKIKR